MILSEKSAPPGQARGQAFRDHAWDRRGAPAQTIGKTDPTDGPIALLAVCRRRAGRSMERAEQRSGGSAILQSLRGPVRSSATPAIERARRPPAGAAAGLSAISRSAARSALSGGAVSRPGQSPPARSAGG